MTGFWAVGAVLQSRISWIEVLLIEVAALATVTSALALLEWHFIFKPAAMVVAIIFAGIKSIKTPASGRFYLYLVLALTASLAGDVLLMLPGQLFIPGLASFLVPPCWAGCGYWPATTPPKS